MPCNPNKRRCQKANCRNWIMRGHPLPNRGERSSPKLNFVQSAHRNHELGSGPVGAPKGNFNPHGKATSFDANTLLLVGALVKQLLDPVASALFTQQLEAYLDQLPDHVRADFQAILWKNAMPQCGERSSPELSFAQSIASYISVASPLNSRRKKSVRPLSQAMDVRKANSELGGAQPRHVPLTGKKAVENNQRKNNQQELSTKMLTCPAEIPFITPLNRTFNRPVRLPTTWSSRPLWTFAIANSELGLAQPFSQAGPPPGRGRLRPLWTFAQAGPRPAKLPNWAPPGRGCSRKPDPARPN